MATRKMPSYEEIVEVLATGWSGPSLPTETVGSISWNEAAEHIRKGLKTSSDKAREWLREATTGDGAPLILVELISGQVAVREGAPRQNLMKDFGWSKVNVSDLAFDHHGQLILPGDHLERTGHSLRIMRRADLDTMREMLTMARTEVDRSRNEKNAKKLAEFRVLHGDALDTITAVIRSSITLASWDDGKHLLETGTFARWADLYGTDGQLTITLRGRQIDDFAEALRKLNR